MKIDEVTRFFGVHAQSSDFDSYLSTHGISYRPVFNETPIDRISVEKKGISLVFDTAPHYKKFYGPPAEGGDMVLSSVQAYGADNDSGFTQYPAPLPYGLSFKSTLEDAIKIFGNPTTNHPLGQNRCYVWYNYHGNTVKLCLLPDSQGVSFFSLSKAKLKPPIPFDLE